MHRWPVLPGPCSLEDKGFDGAHIPSAVRETVRTSSASPAASEQALGGARGRDPEAGRRPFGADQSAPASEWPIRRRLTAEAGSGARPRGVRR